MNGLELGLVTMMACGVALVISSVVSDAWETGKQIMADIKTEEAGAPTPKIYVKDILDNLYLDVADAIEYQNSTGVVVGASYDNLVTILLDDGSVIDVPVGKLRKVVTL